MNPFFDNSREVVLAIDVIVFQVDIFPVRIRWPRKARPGHRAPKHYVPRARVIGHSGPRFL
jgi:hypothetical protein